MGAVGIRKMHISDRAGYYIVSNLFHHDQSGLTCALASIGPRYHLPYLGFTE